MTECAWVLRIIFSVYLLAWSRYEPTVHSWSHFSSSYIMGWSARAALDKAAWCLDETWLKSYVWKEQPEREGRPSHMHWKRGSACMCLWDDERRQMGEKKKKKNAAVTSVLIAAQEMWHVCLCVRRRSQTPKLHCSCETAAQRPPAVSLQRVLISGTKPSSDFLPSIYIWALVAWIARIYLTVELAT